MGNWRHEKTEETEAPITQRFERGAGVLNERTRRLVAASEAMALGRGGIAAVSRATGRSRHVIGAGIKERQEGTAVAQGRIRRAGGGRTWAVSNDVHVQEDRERLGEPMTRGDPDSPLRWTGIRVRTLVAERVRQGHQVSHQLVSEVLPAAGDRVQADRHAPFEHLHAEVHAFLAAGDPAISVDAKKKERVGDVTNPGRAWCPTGEPEQVRVHDVPITGLGRATPSGIDDLTHTTGWVTVGSDHETAAFAGERIRPWGKQVGQQPSPQATRLVLGADGGGSHGSRVHVWTGIRRGDGVRDPCVPCAAGNEHREHDRASPLCAGPGQNGRGIPLTSDAMILTLLASIKTQAGLTVHGQRDTHTFPTGLTISKEALATLALVPHAFHGEWNDVILPRFPVSDHVLS